MQATCPCDLTGYLLGIGNPLLDISAIVQDDLLAKYGLKPDDAIMAEEKHMPLYKELMDNYCTQFIAGGSVQNSLRVAQWILKKPNLCAYFGCVGNDDYAKILKERAIADGVDVHYQVNNEVPTGTCAVLVTNMHRSLCANLAAAQKFTPEFLASEESQESIKKAKIFYTSGFFLAVSLPSIMLLAKRAHETGNWFVMNLSAPFVSQFYKEPLSEVMPYVDILFGNESEAEAFSKAFGLGETEPEKIAVKIANLPKLNAARPRAVVITQGCDPVILAEGSSKVFQTPVEKLPRELIVDTNGAGDAFAGGFLSQLVLNKPLTHCIKGGIYAAAHIIQNSGCTFSHESKFLD